jgi:hypothetical protein
MSGNWIFWVVIFWWVIPMVMRKMRQPGTGPGRPPYPRDDRDQYGRDQYGQYPQYPQPDQYPQAPQGGQYPQSGIPEGQIPEGQGTTTQGQPGLPWWQQPLPPGFPGQPTQQAQPAPQAQPTPQGQAGASARPSSQAATGPVQAGAPDDAPQGYRAKKLAELDRQFSEQKISLEEYMKARNEVMRG